MRSSARTALRETGTALAVLALYALMLLLPLHQAAAQQRDLNALGYSTLSSWSVCALLATDEHGKPAEAAAVNCPALGVAKHFAVLDAPPPPQFAFVAVALAADLSFSGDVLASHLPDHVGQSRAPPIAV